MTKLINFFRNNFFKISACMLAMAIILLSFNAFADPDADYLEYCQSDKFDEKYEAGGCWACDVIAVIMKAMLSTITQLFVGMIELCKLVLVLGAAIWLAVYFLKSLSAFAAQDPAKIIDGALTFMFKWALVYTLIFWGIGEIINNIVSPLLSIGIDIGTIFSQGADI